MFPKILDIGPVTIHTYGLMLALAFIAGIWIASRNARKAGISPDSIWNMGLVVIFASLVGAKILLIFSDYQYYSQNFKEIFSLSTLRSSGVYYGGLLLALGAAAWYMVKNRLPAWTIADLSAPGIALGQAIGRIGCLSAGCCYGGPTSMPWGITYTSQYASDNFGVPRDISLHPTPIYESLGSFCLFWFLMWRLKRKRITGQIILEYLSLYALLRFAIEFYRGDFRGEYMLYGLLSPSQFIAVLTFLGSAVVYYFLLRRSKAHKKN